MEKNNSIINSLKRLERVGSETSRVTLKLKQSCEEVADMIDDLLQEYTESYCRNDFNRIVGKLYYFGGHLIWDWDGNAGCENIDNYILRPDTGYVTRKCALSFARAISEGLVNRITKWIQNRKEEAKEGIKNLE